MDEQTKNSMGCYKSFVVSLIALLAFGISTASGRHTVGLQVNNRFKCGGSLVSTMHIVTGAQCVAGVSPKYMTVVMNVSYIPNYWTEDDGERHEVQRIKTHPEFKVNSERPVHNIAVVTLKNPILVTDDQGPIALPTINNILGSAAIVFGWWAESKDNKIVDHKMYFFFMNLMKKTNCTDIGLEVSMHICITIKVKDSYKPAKPGEGVISGRKLIGLLSYFTQRIENNVTYAIMRIEPYLDFIHEEAKNDIPGFDGRSPLI